MSKHNGGDGVFWLVVIISTIVIIPFAYAVYYVSKHKKTPVMKKEEELQGLKKEQEKLEKEAKEIEEKKPFDNVNDAIDYINDTIRKRK